MSSKSINSRIEGLSNEDLAALAEARTSDEWRVIYQTSTSPTIDYGSRRKGDGQAQIEQSSQTSQGNVPTSPSDYYSNVTTPFQNHLKQSTQTMPVKTDMALPSESESRTNGSRPWDEQPRPKALTYDEGKAPLAQLPWAAVEALSRVQLYGHTKYKDFNNYRKGMEVSRNLSCALRHIKEYLEGHDVDKESGESPLAHAMCRVSFVLQNLADGTAVDDRYKPGLERYK